MSRSLRFVTRSGVNRLTRLLLSARQKKQVEKAIGVLGKKARDNTLSVDDMAGGTFTISNGGVYGSLLSTPIVNPPQVRPPVRPPARRPVRQPARQTVR